MSYIKGARPRNKPTVFFLLSSQTPLIMFRKVNLTSYTIRGKVWKIKMAARMKMEKARKGRKWSYLTMVPATNSNKRLRFTSKEIS